MYAIRSYYVFPFAQAVVDLPHALPQPGDGWTRGVVMLGGAAVAAQGSRVISLQGVQVADGSLQPDEIRMTQSYNFV